jgi:multisubunit Na+/H+ antiporter MnhB subunit
MRMHKVRAAKVITVLALLAFLAFTSTKMHGFGMPAHAAMDDYFIQNGQAETGSNNIVAAILFDYRGLDTLGEASVLFAAASGIFLLFRRLGR